ncbi:MAG: hypothetical protein NUK62_01115 [Tenericutes bacterium]|nr:hypothetical protein [Mycoplasmatota bacterium]
MTFRLKTRLMTLSLVLILVLSSSLLVVYAYFVKKQDHGIIVATGEFTVEIFASFNDVVVNTESPYYDAQKNIIIVNAYDQLSENYIGNLKIDIGITPEVAARVRIKLQDEWELTRIYLDQNPEYPIDPVIENVYHTPKGSGYYPFSLLKINPTFNGIYDLQGYTYINQIIPKNQTTMIHFIDSGDRYPARTNEVFYEMCYVYIDLIVDVVQANRFVEKWGIEPDFFG